MCVCVCSTYDAVITVLLYVTTTDRPTTKYSACVAFDRIHGGAGEGTRDSIYIHEAILSVKQAVCGWEASV